MNVGLQWEGLILLLLFVAPGFVFTRRYLAFRPPRYFRPPDAFEQMVIVIIASTLIHVGLLGSVATLILVHWLVTGKVVSLQDLLAPPGILLDLWSYPLPTLAGYVLAMALYLALSLFVARRAGEYLGKLAPERLPRWCKALLGANPPEQVLLWHRMLIEEPMEQGVFSPRVSVWMRSGERFEGNLITLRWCGDEANTIELALENVTYWPAPRDTGSPQPPMTLPRHKILLRSTDILWISRIDAPGGLR